MAFKEEDRIVVLGKSAARHGSLWHFGKHDSAVLPRHSRLTLEERGIFGATIDLIKDFQLRLTSLHSFFVIILIHHSFVMMYLFCYYHLAGRRREARQSQIYS